MKIYVQWSTDPESDLIALGSSEWAGLPKKPLPVGGEVIDDQPGWIHCLNVQGVLLRADHIAVWDIDGGIKVAAWNDDPEDHAGDSHGKVWTFLPPAIDRLGRMNTRQSFVKYRQRDDGRREDIMEGPLRAWEEFPFPPEEITRHGIWVPDELEHRLTFVVRSEHGWREWIDG